MPAPSLKSLAKEAGVSMADAERYWSEAKKSAKEQGKSEQWDYIMGIVKKRMGLSEDIDPASLLHPTESTLSKPTMIEDKIHPKGTKIIWL